MITPHIPKIVIKNVFTFLFSLCIRMSEKKVNFGDKKIKKCDFYKSKKSSQDMAQKIHLNTLLDTMIMILLDHYA